MEEQGIEVEEIRESQRVLINRVVNNDATTVKEKIKHHYDKIQSHSYVVKEALKVLHLKHMPKMNSVWSSTSGGLVSYIETPGTTEHWSLTKDPTPGHTDHFPQMICDLISKTHSYCDIATLMAPDGLFLEKIQEGLENVAKNSHTQSNPIIVRILFGNALGVAVNSAQVFKSLIARVPSDANIQLWVGGWRKSQSWNHAKIIAVDGKYIMTGGHNMWSDHYLSYNPVHDLSLQLEGDVADDGHHYLDHQWSFVARESQRVFTKFLKEIREVHVTLHKFSAKGTTIAKVPPMYSSFNVITTSSVNNIPNIPILTLGRLGNISFGSATHRPSDDAIIAMILAAKETIRLGQQDIGPMTYPFTTVPFPGLKWPRRVLDALATAIWKNNVVVELILCNSWAVPGRVHWSKGIFGNGWSCDDVTYKILRAISRLEKNPDYTKMISKVTTNLRISFAKHSLSKKYEDGGSIGLHSKFFIIDDICTYIGSQNLYLCDLAEWGVVLDDKDTTLKFMDEVWYPMMEASYNRDDTKIEKVKRRFELRNNHLYVFNKRKEMNAALAEIGEESKGVVYCVARAVNEAPVTGPLSRTIFTQANHDSK